MSSHILAPRALQNLETRNLACGATLIVAVNPGLPIFTAQVLVDAGHMVESRDTDGLLNLAGRLLFSGGAGDRSGPELFAELESAGVRYASLGSGLRLEATTRRAELVFDVLADALRRPRFDADRFELERSRMRTELLAAEDDLRTVARHEFNAMVYGTDHPLGRPARGNVQLLGKFAREQMIALHHEFVGPERLLFAVAGDVDADQVASQLDRRLADWRHPVAPRPQYPQLALRSGEELFVERPKEKLHIYMGHLGIRRHDPDYDALLVMDHIFGSGSGFTSRISKRIRDQLGLAYSVYGSMTDSAGREPGLFTVYAGTFPEKLAEVTSAVREEVDRLLESGVTAAEVDAAQRYLRGSFLFETESNSQLAELAIGIQLHQLGLDFATKHLAAVQQVTPEQIMKAANAHLHRDSLVTIAVGRRPIMGTVRG